MKKITLALTLLTSMSFVFGQVSESVFLQAGYTNQSYYHLDNGEVTNVDNTNWDLAFDASSMGGSIRINGSYGTKLYLFGDANSWSSVDTVGFSWNEIINSDLSWSDGAFNSNSNSFTDYGWGEYSMISHFISGKTVHIIKFLDGSCKKIQIEKLQSGTYHFKYANLDGSNEVDTTVSKSDYAGKNFGYYSIQNDSALDREPTADSWHLVFTKYIKQLSPTYSMGVTGVLTNNGLEVAKAENVDVANADHNNFSFVPEINAIGYNWKSYDYLSDTYDIQDALCYFVKDNSDRILKLEFTGFDGSSTGGIHFNVNLTTATEIATYENDLLFRVYPNPSQGRQVSILYDIDQLDLKNSVDIYDMNGRIVKSFRLNSNGFNDKRISLDNFEAGVYLISFKNGNEVIKRKLIVQ